MKRITNIGLILSVVLVTMTLQLWLFEKSYTAFEKNNADKIEAGNVIQPLDFSHLERLPVSMSPPTTLTLNVTAGDNDLEENLANGKVTNSSDLELAEDGNKNQLIAIRYTDVFIQQGTTITSAYIDFICDETTSGATSVTFTLEDSDDAEDLALTNFNLTNRIKTTSSVDWNNIPAWNTVGELHTTPDLAAIIQEVINRPGWTPGSDITVLIEGSGTRIAEAYNSSSPQDAPVLRINFDAPVAEKCWAIAQTGGGNLYSWQTNGINNFIGNTNTIEIETMTMNGSCDEIHAVDGNVYGHIDTLTGAFTSLFTLTTMEANGVNENINDIDGFYRKKKCKS